MRGRRGVAKRAGAGRRSPGECWPQLPNLRRARFGRSKQGERESRRGRTRARRAIALRDRASSPRVEARPLLGGLPAGKGVLAAAGKVCARAMLRAAACSPWGVPRTASCVRAACCGLRLLGTPLSLVTSGARGRHDGWLGFRARNFQFTGGLHLHHVTPCFWVVAFCYRTRRHFILPFEPRRGIINL